jgi:hypothetical protein
LDCDKGHSIEETRVKITKKDKQVRIWGNLKQNGWRGGVIVADIEVEGIMGGR